MKLTDKLLLAITIFSIAMLSVYIIEVVLKAIEMNVI